MPTSSMSEDQFHKDKETENVLRIYTAITASQAEMEIVVIMKFRSQMAMLCHVCPIKFLIKILNIHVGLTCGEQ
jgi:hypothetical protein